ncbi:MAG: GNAT family N-acetyltransferase [Neomegalonema sp.]|nr:GNAT family N-acetyltransferase [Neomegalonema sp.]
MIEPLAPPPLEAGGLRIEPMTGAKLMDALPALAELRTTVFRAFPYLYDGDLAREQSYLRAYAEDAGAIIVAAYDGAQMVGAATGAPMAGQHAEWSEPFLARDYDLADIFYCGESVLLPDYRGRGVGHAFFDHREAQAWRMNARLSCFCAVIRPDDHPARPADYRPLDGFWRKRGYAPEPGLVAHFDWREVGHRDETAHELQFWLRPLQGD